MTEIVVRLEIERMKQQILYAFTQYQSQITDEVEKRLENVIGSFNWQEAVDKAFDAAMTEVIRDNIRRAISESFGHAEIVSKVQEVTRRAIGRYLKG